MSALGLIKKPEKLLGKFAKFHQNSKFSDVTLIVGQTKLVAHRFVLGMHSDYFENLLHNENYKEAKEPEVSILAPVEAFTLLLQYMYTGTVDLRKHKATIAAEFLELCHRFGFNDLESEIVDYLGVAVVDASSAVEVLEIVKVLGKEFIERNCWTLIKMGVEGIIENTEMELPHEILAELIFAKEKRLNEVNLFKAIIKYTSDPSYCTEEEKNELFQAIKYERMTAIELRQEVEPNFGVNDDIGLLKLYRTLALNNAQKINEESNIETKALVTASEKESGVHLFSSGEEGISWVFENDKVTLNIGAGKKFTCNTNVGKAILVDLGAIYTFNHIQFNVDGKSCFPTCQYFIEASKDEENWEKVVDYSEFKCWRKQILYFSETRARFIKIWGKPLEPSDKFSCNSFKISFEENHPKFLEDLVIPNENIVTTDRAFIYYFDEDRICYDQYILEKFAVNRAQFVSQKIRNGWITILFHQPYILDSLRIKLWDEDDRKYLFEIYVAVDQSKWGEIVYKSKDWVNGWQEVHFSPRPVSEIQICGMNATIGDELRITEFEAPAARAT